MPFHRSHALVAAILALASISTPTLAAAAEDPSAPAIAQANATCAAFFSQLGDKMAALGAAARALSKDQADPQARAAYADALDAMADASLAADHRLAAVKVPNSLRRSYARMLRFDREANGTLPKQEAKLLRQPASAANTRQLIALSKREIRVDRRFAQMAASLDITGC